MQRVVHDFPPKGKNPSFPLGELAPLSRWCAYREEPQPDGKKGKKPPRNPATGRYAKVTDPKTWGTREAAQALALRLRNGHPTGVGP